MSGIVASLERFVPLLEKYLTCSNKAAFANNLTDPTEKVFLNVLTSPISSLEDFQKEIKKLGFNSEI